MLYKRSQKHHLKVTGPDNTEIMLKEEELYEEDTSLCNVTEINQEKSSEDNENIYWDPTEKEN